MTPVDVAALLEHYADKIRRIRGACHRNPHAFIEDKSDVIGAMLADAKRFRTPERAKPVVTQFRPGTVVTRSGREVRAEVRRKAV